MIWKKVTDLSSSTHNGCRMTSRSTASIRRECQQLMMVVITIRTVRAAERWHPKLIEQKHQVALKAPPMSWHSTSLTFQKKRPYKAPWVDDFLKAKTIIGGIIHARLEGLQLWKSYYSNLPNEHTGMYDYRFLKKNLDPCFANSFDQ